MATKKQKTQAEKTVSAAKNKNSKNTNKAADAKMSDSASKVPVRLISSLVLLAMVVLFGVILFASEGALLKFVENLIHGLIGRVGFIVSIPVLLYLFFIHAFSGKRPIKLRTTCLIIFILLCSCVSHLNDISGAHPKGIAMITGLYNSGMSGTTGGVICGLIAMGIFWLCGPIVSYIALVIAAIVMLMGGMGITIPGLIRAYRERPRAEWEEEEQEQLNVDPSATVVNHIATKRIEYLEQKRIRDAERAAQAEAEAKRRAAEEAARSKKPLTKVEDIMSQIDNDVEDPVAASGIKSAQEEDVDILPIVKTPIESPQPLTDVPVQMPPLEIERAVEEPPQEIERPVEVSPAPKKEPTKRSKVTQQDAEESAAQVAQEIAQAETEKKPVYCYPPIDLLKLPGDGKTDGTAEIPGALMKL